MGKIRNYLYSLFVAFFISTKTVTGIRNICPTKKYITQTLRYAFGMKGKKQKPYHVRIRGVWGRKFY